MKSIKDLMDRDVIHCPTEEEAKDILKLAHEAGYKWCNGNSYLSPLNEWGRYEANTCYNITVGEYCSLGYCKSSNYTIHKASEFLNKTNMKKIIGYICPMDLFNGEVKKGTIYKKKGHYINWEPQKGGNISNYTIPEEIVTQWEAVYEDIWEPKVGDWVITTSETENYRYKYKKGEIFKITRIVQGNFEFQIGDSAIVMANRCRKATKEEIQTHLIAEAQRRGFVEDVKYLDAFVNRDAVIAEHTWSYTLISDSLYNNGNVVYCDGKWATMMPQEQTMSVGGKFDVLIKNSKIYYSLDDITDFVKEMIEQNTAEFGKYGGYSAGLKDIIFSYTGCQHVETRLSDWKKVYDKWKELQ